jgi:hypothetical protein
MNQIIIDNPADFTLDLPMLSAILARCPIWFQDGLNNRVTINIGVFDRQPNGWLEYSQVVRRDGKIQITIGCIQRYVGAEYEFHS